MNPAHRHHRHRASLFACLVTLTMSFARPLTAPAGSVICLSSSHVSIEVSAAQASHSMLQATCRAGDSAEHGPCTDVPLAAVDALRVSAPRLDAAPSSSTVMISPTVDVPRFLGYALGSAPDRTLRGALAPTHLELRVLLI
jgi:hypothetical protein